MTSLWDLSAQRPRFGSDWNPEISDAVAICSLSSLAGIWFRHPSSPCEPKWRERHNVNHWFLKLGTKPLLRCRNEGGNGKALSQSRMCSGQRLSGSETEYLPSHHLLFWWLFVTQGKHGKGCSWRRRERSLRRLLSIKGNGRWLRLGSCSAVMPGVWL